LRILTGSDVQCALSMRDAITIVKRAFAELSTGKAHVPLRSAIPQEKNYGTTLLMPGYLFESDALAVKIVSVHDRNRERNLPLIHALVVLIDSVTGQPLSVMEGSYLTALRTAAASGVATELLARADAQVAAIFGAGAQGRAQLLALCAVLPIKRAWIYDRKPLQVKSFISQMQDRLEQSVELLAAESPAQAVREAEVICTATTSLTPVFDGADLQPGTHINGIGSYMPHMQEVDVATLRRASKIVVDSRASALAEAGDLLVALEQDAIHPTDIYSEIGEIAAGMKAGRENAKEITYFKSVGNAVQDVGVAIEVYHQALKRNLGVEVEL